VVKRFIKFSNRSAVPDSNIGSVPPGTGDHHTDDVIADERE